MSTVYRLTLRQMFGPSRLLVMAILAAMPVLVTAVTLADGHSPTVREYEQFVLSSMLVGSIVPLIVLAIAAPSFANEIEDKTLANITLTPIPRWQIAAAKLLATLTMAAPLIAASAFATSQIAFLGDVQATSAVTGAVLVGVLLYASLFVWLGLASPQAVGVGLLYVVLWEGFFAGFVSGVRMLSIRYHTIAMMHGFDARRFAVTDHPRLVVAAIISVAFVAALFFFAVRRLRRMDVP